MMRIAATANRRRSGVGAAVIAAVMCGVLAAPSAAAPPAYYPSGPQVGVARSALTGWTVCHQSNYNDTNIPLVAILVACDGDYLLLAGGPVGAPTFDVLAAAPRADVITDTGVGNTPHDANGSGWYFSPESSWGFAPQGSPIHRVNCDAVDSSVEGGATDGDKRLCWHTGSLSCFAGNLCAGWRSGRADGLLAGVTTHERFIYEPAAAAQYSDEVLDLSPGGYWRFGEPSGTALLDSSPSANNGTYLGGVTLGAAGAIVGDPNTAASYDGVNDTGRVPDANSLDVGSSFTMEGWIKRSSTTKSQELFNKGQNGLQLTVMSAASGNKVWLRKAGVTTIAQSTTGVPADGSYHYVAATMNGNGTTAHVYIDGTDVTQLLPAGAAQSIANTAFPLTFGGAASAQAFYDEFALYDEALPSCEIGDHYTTATGGPYIGC